MDQNSLRGHLDGLILAVLEQEPQHGYAVIEALQERSGGALEVPTGTAYPALRRLERAGFVESHWGEVGGRRRRTYQLTPRGRTELSKHRTSWREFAAAIDGVLNPRLA